MNQNDVFMKAQELKEIFPWYKELIKNAQNYNDLPFLTKELLDEHYYGIFQDGKTEFKTSGTSSGKKRSIFYSSSEMNYNNNQKRKLFGDFIGEYKKVGIVVGIGLAASSAEDVFRALNKIPFIIRHDDSFEKLVSTFKKESPEVLYSMPSIVESMILNNSEIVKSIKKIILVGELLTNEARKRMADSFGISCSDILNTYGCVELGIIGYECNSCNRFHIFDHLFPDIFSLTTITEDIIKSKSANILVLSSMWRDSFPGIKYVTYDLIEDLRTTKCNNLELCSFKRIIGRVGTELKHGERISQYDIEKSILNILPDAEYRIVVERNKLMIQVLNKGYPEKKIIELEKNVNEQANIGVGSMIKNNYLKPIQIEIKEKNETINWKKRIEFKYSDSEEESL